jgi:hypothetical protein
MEFELTFKLTIVQFTLKLGSLLEPKASKFTCNVGPKQKSKCFLSSFSAPYFLGVMIHIALGLVGYFRFCPDRMKGWQKLY